MKPRWSKVERDERREYIMNFRLELNTLLVCFSLLCLLVLFLFASPSRKLFSLWKTSPVLYFPALGNAPLPQSHVLPRITATGLPRYSILLEREYFEDKTIA